ncbi:MAG TPA: hypothetical protein VGK41_09900, partial [Solirubrobacterales bacterium]
MTVDLIADYEKHLKRLDRAESTIESYLETLHRMDRELPHGLLVAVPDELEAWLFDNDWSPATRHLRRAAVCGFFKFASSPKRRVHLDWNPAADLHSVRVPRGRPRPAPEKVVEDIIVRARQPYRDWYVIGAFAGARCIEISNLDREHIGEEETVLHGKGGKVRSVPTHPLLRELAALLPDGPVAAVSGVRLDRRAVSRRANWYLRQLGHSIT